MPATIFHLSHALTQDSDTRHCEVHCKFQEFLVDASMTAKLKVFSASASSVVWMRSCVSCMIRERLDGECFTASCANLLAVRRTLV